MQPTKRKQKGVRAGNTAPLNYEKLGGQRFSITGRQYITKRYRRA